MAEEIGTRQRSAQFYQGWFFRCHRSSEQGWYAYQTPDGRSIMHQDAYFWRCLEVICRQMNILIVEENAKGRK